MTLASDHTTSRSADREGIPPTLLRLPDLDPPQTVVSNEAAADTAAKATSAADAASVAAPHDAPHDAQPAFRNPTPSPQPASSQSAMRTHVDSAVSAAVIASESSVDADSKLPPEGKPLVQPARRHEQQALRHEQSTSNEPAVTDEANWLTMFASRKTLLILLALIAGAAIFLPRGQNTSSEHATPKLVDNGTRPASAPSSTSGSLADPHEAHHGRDSLQAQRSSGAKLRQPIASHVPSRAHVDVSEPITLEPPAKSQLASQSQPGKAVPTDSPSVEPLDDFDMTIAFPSESELAADLDSTATQTDRFGQSYAAETPSAMSEAAFAPAQDDPAARLVESRTPNAITDWKKFLPGMNVAESSEPSDASAETNIRTSGAPAEPNFEFALPGDPSVNASSTGSTTEARVAMPPTQSTPPSRY